MANTTMETYILGVGLTKFQKPRGKADYAELGHEAGVKAMLDAHITYDDVDQGVACYCYGDSTCGQRVFYQFGMTQIPIYNVNNNCATGSTGLYMARNLIGHGAADCVLVVGFEKMQPGSLQSNFRDRANPLGAMVAMMKKDHVETKAPFAAQMFAHAGLEYMEKYRFSVYCVKRLRLICSRYGAQASDLAEIARVNHKHSRNNPYSQFQDVYTHEQISSSPMVEAPLTKLQCCPTSDGGAAAVVVSKRFLVAHPELQAQAIFIAGQCMATDSPSLFNRSAMNLVGFEMTRYAARKALEEAKLSIKDVGVCELHDCFSSSELLSIDGLGLSEPGKAHEYVRQGKITYGGQMVVNPSGGLISKGHPLGATGLAQCAELVWQLRGWANNRLVENTRAALAHNVGLGGAIVVTVYQRADGMANSKLSDEEVRRITGTGYNPATEARGITAAQVESTKSRQWSEWASAGLQKQPGTSL